MFWLEFNLGANAGVQPGDFVGCIAGETGLPREIVGAIRVQPDRSYVEVAKDCLEGVLAAVNRTRIKGRRVMARLGRPQTWRAEAGPGRSRGGPGGEEG